MIVARARWKLTTNWGMTLTCKFGIFFTKHVVSASELLWGWGTGDVPLASDLT
jgi:hypothetical protein